MQVAVEHWFRPCYLDIFFLRKLLLACQMTVGSHSSTVSHTLVSYISSVWHKSTSSGLLWLYKLISWGTGLKKHRVRKPVEQGKKSICMSYVRADGHQTEKQVRKGKGAAEGCQQWHVQCCGGLNYSLGSNTCRQPASEVLLDRCLGF